MGKVARDGQTFLVGEGDGMRGSGDRVRRRAIDGLVVGGREVWVLVAPEGEGEADALIDMVREDPDPLRLCRAVLAGGVLVLGTSQPDRDPLLSDLLRGDEGNGAA